MHEFLLLTRHDIRLLDILPACYLSSIWHSLHEEEGSKYNTNLYCYHEVEYYCKYESQHQNDYVALRRGPAQMEEACPVCHVGCNNEKYCRKTCHRYHWCEGHEKHQNNCKCDTVNHACNRRAATVSDIGCSPCYSTCGRYATEESWEDITQTLTHKFCVGLVCIANHSVGYNGWEQRLNSRKDRYCEGRWDKLTYHFEGNCRQLRSREWRIQFTEYASYCINLKARNFYKKSCNYNSYERARYFVGNLRPYQHNDYSKQSDKSGLGINQWHILNKGRNLWQEVWRHVFKRITEEILKLSHEQCDGDSTGEACSDCIRNVLNQGTEVTYSHDYQYDSRKDCSNNQAVGAVGCHNSIDDYNEGCSRSANLNPASAEYRNKKSCDYCCI